MKYYPKKEEAEARRTVVADDPRVANTAVQFEPYNGWVVVVIPKRMDCSDLAETCEIRDGIPRPVPEKVRPEPIAPAPSLASGEGAQTPVSGSQGQGRAPKGSGVSARVWAIADELHGDRPAIIAKAVAEGINKATATTQYSRWKKARNK